MFPDRLAEIDSGLHTVGDKGFSPRLAKSWAWAPEDGRRPGRSRTVSVRHPRIDRRRIPGAKGDAAVATARLGFAPPRLSGRTSDRYVPPGPAQSWIWSGPVSAQAT